VSLSICFRHSSHNYARANYACFLLKHPLAVEEHVVPLYLSFQGFINSFIIFIKIIKLSSLKRFFISDY
jgi:hypothetical protein